MTSLSPTDYARQYEAELAVFVTKARNLGLEEAEHFHWYHTIDLGNGLITPGFYDYRPTVGQFQFPDLAGKTVLDVGPATGFFSFYFDSQGAKRVVGAELPSLLELDRFPGQTVLSSLRKIHHMMYPLRPPMAERDLLATERDLYWKLLDGPYRFCHDQLGSKAERYFVPIYDLTLEKLNIDEPFDIVFAGDVLLHLLEPFRALAALASLCKGTLILAQGMPNDSTGQPLVHYVGGTGEDDESSWWHPNSECFRQVLTKLGFPTVREVGSHSGLLKTSGYFFERTVLHATRG